jgi:hypothetical protein
MTSEDGRNIQAALCLKPDTGTVTFGRATRAAIGKFRTTSGHQGPTGGLTTSEAILLMNTAPCDTTQFANVFEYLQYRTDGRATSVDKISRLQEKLAANAPPGHPPAAITGTFDGTTRAAIADIQKANGSTPTGQVTRDFLNLLVK